MPLFCSIRAQASQAIRISSPCRTHRSNGMMFTTVLAGLRLPTPLLPTKTSLWMPSMPLSARGTVTVNSALANEYVSCQNPKSSGIMWKSGSKCRDSWLVPCVALSLTFQESGFVSSIRDARKLFTNPAQWYDVPFQLRVRIESLVSDGVHLGPRYLKYACQDACTNQSCTSASFVVRLTSSFGPNDFRQSVTVVSRDSTTALFSLANWRADALRPPPLLSASENDAPNFVTR